MKENKWKNMRGVDSESWRKLKKIGLTNVNKLQQRNNLKIFIC